MLGDKAVKNKKKGDHQCPELGEQCCKDVLCLKSTHIQAFCEQGAR